MLGGRWRAGEGGRIGVRGGSGRGHRLQQVHRPPDLAPWLRAHGHCHGLH